MLHLTDIYICNLRHWKLIRCIDMRLRAGSPLVFVVLSIRPKKRRCIERWCAKYTIPSESENVPPNAATLKVWPNPQLHKGILLHQLYLSVFAPFKIKYAPPQTSMRLIHWNHVQQGRRLEAYKEITFKFLRVCFWTWMECPAPNCNRFSLCNQLYQGRLVACKWCSN